MDLEALLDEFYRRIEQPSFDACWPWTGKLTHDGYGDWRVPRRFSLLVPRTYWRAHRLAWFLDGRPLPAGQPLDHRCHDPHACTLGVACPHRRCCNPTHLTLSTPAENQARSSSAVRTHCPAGHPYSGANLRLVGTNRQCRQCGREASARRWAANRERYNANRRAKARS